MPRLNTLLTVPVSLSSRLDMRGYLKCRYNRKNRVKILLVSDALEAAHHTKGWILEEDSAPIRKE